MRQMLLCCFWGYSLPCIQADYLTVQNRRQQQLQYTENQPFKAAYNIICKSDTCCCAGTGVGTKIPHFLSQPAGCTCWRKAGLLLCGAGKELCKFDKFGPFCCWFCSWLICWATWGTGGIPPAGKLLRIATSVIKIVEYQKERMKLAI